MVDPTEGVPFGDLTFIGQLEEATFNRATNEQSALLDENESGFLPVEDVEQFFDSVNSPQNTLDQQNSPFFGRTTPLLYDEDGGASTDFMGSGALTADTRGPVDSYPDFQQLGVVTSSGEANNIATSDDISTDVVYPDNDQTKQPVQQCNKPAVNEKLRRTIQTRRRKSGLDDIKVEWKQPKPEVLTARDEVRLERRRESNRRAAAKSRIKKREENEQNKKMMKQLMEENKLMKSKLDKFMAVQQHLLTCSDCHHLRNILSDAG